MKKKYLAVLMLIGIVTSVKVAADYTNTPYDVNVKPFNGNGYTYYKYTVNGKGLPGYTYVENVGGNYVVDARMQDEHGQVSEEWTRNLNDKKYYELDGSTRFYAYEYVRMQLSNDWNTPVSVNVKGEWDNDPFRY